MKKTTQVKGITLIALVITIIILLILAGISILAVTSDNGLFGRAKEAKEKTEIGQAQEEISNILNEWAVEKTVGTQTMKEFLNSKVIKSEIDSVTDNGDETYEVITNAGYMVIVNENGNIIGEIQKAGPRPQVSDLKIVENSSGTGENLNKDTVEEGKIVYIMFKHSIEGGTTIVDKTLPYAVTENMDVEFVITGIVKGKEYKKRYTVKVNQFKVNIIGKFVNYTVQNWTQDEIDSLKTSGFYSGKTGSSYAQFDGFEVGDSKDASVNAYGTNKYSNGWRILNVTDEGIINIVSAATPEAYIHVYGNAYRSEYILSSGERRTDIGNGTPSRSWEMYVNHTYATSAHCMNYDDAYNITNSTAKTADDLRFVGSIYWLASADDSSNGVMWHVYDNGSMDYRYDNIERFGIRPVVSLKAEIKIIGGTGTQADPYQIGF